MIICARSFTSAIAVKTRYPDTRGTRSFPTKITKELLQDSLEALYKTLGWVGLGSLDFLFP